MWIKIEVSREDFEKLECLDGFSEKNAIQTSYTDWIEFICQPDRLNPKTDCAWINWDDLTPPKDVKGIFIWFENDQIWTDAHFYGSEEYRMKTCGDSKPVKWTFMERSNPKEKSVLCKSDVIVRTSDESGRGSSEELDPPINSLGEIGHESNSMVKFAQAQAITQDTAIRNLLCTRSGN